MAGCGTQRSANVIIAHSSAPGLTSEEQARIHDIPFPSQVYPTKILFSETQLVLSYSTHISQSKLIDFFLAGMEYWGWELLGNVLAQESCLMFAKPSKVCSITLRKEDDSTRVLIFSTLKKSR